jgi:hypothetical protein
MGIRLDDWVDRDRPLPTPNSHKAQKTTVSETPDALRQTRTSTSMP